MPLNHVSGETVEGMDAIFRVVAVEKYHALPRLTTIVKERRGKKFRREVDVEKPIWIAALDHAQRCFFNAGANPGSLAYDCIVQEYPRTGCVCFIFEAVIDGVSMFVTAPFRLGPDQIADLSVRNLWQPYTLNS